jgi:hypothetical protein
MDNRYFSYGCPAIWSDARGLTNYTDKRVLDQFIRSVNQIYSAQDYKNFLQMNGDTIMNRERALLHKMNTCEVYGNCIPISKSTGN